MYRRLQAAPILETITRLRERIHDRFPGSGLSKVATELEVVGREAMARADWIGRPHVPLRIGIGLLALLIVLTAALGIASLPIHFRLESFAEFVQAVESGINDVVFIGIAIFFLVRLEARTKRARALKAIHELRSLAHIIDMHQLTKDPQVTLNPGLATRASPQRTLGLAELVRYLDYCSEMLSLIGKVAALYVEKFDDAVVLGAVDEIEGLTNEFSRKIWQKISIVQADARSRRP